MLGFEKLFGFNTTQKKTLKEFVDEAIAGGTEGEVTSVNGVEPVAGDVTLAASDLGATAVGEAVFTAADAATARTAIGAGTSNLALGTTGTTALAGNGTAVAATTAAACTGNSATATTAAACSGNSATASALQTGRTITLTGGAAGVSGAFNGSANLSFATTLATPTGALRGGVLQQQLPAVPDPVTKTWFDDTLYPALIATGAFTAPV